MIAIVYFDETELINIISILISLLSVATKSLVFSQAIEFSAFIFHWLSLVTDFFGIFCVLSWVFYNPTNPETISNLGMIWIYQSGIIWLCICVWTAITLAPERMGTDMWDIRTRNSRRWENASIFEISSQVVRAVFFCFFLIFVCV